MQGICLLGATGSIGQSTLDIIAQHPDKFALINASANESVDKMADICRRFKPQRVVMGSQKARDELAQQCHGLAISFEWGEEALDSIASDSSLTRLWLPLWDLLDLSLLWPVYVLVSEHC